MSYRLIDANALNGVISNDDYEKVLNAPYIFADLPNGIDGNHYVLEQEPVLDKIRAEIMDTGAYEQEVNGKTEFLKGINYCLGVIDKYKVESEAENGNTSNNS